MTTAEQAQVKIADETYRRIRAATVTVPSLDADEHAAKVTLVVHRARVLAVRKLK